jgi:hypothetical protein
MDKTVKIRAYPDDAKNNGSQSNLTKDQDKALELVNKNIQLEEERKRSLEYVKAIEQLRVGLNQEQSRTAEMAKRTVELEAKLKELTVLKANEFAKNNAQLEEEKRKSLAHLKTIEQLHERLQQEQVKSNGMLDKMAELEANTKELALLEAKVKELTEVLGKITSVAATVKVG